MSSRGRPSKGCERCRRRKVKCDETRPTCLKCHKAEEVCKYRDQFDIYMRDQTVAAGQRAQQRWRARSRKQSQSEPSDSGSASPSISRQTSRQASDGGKGTLRWTPSPPFSTPILELAINRFFFDYVCAPGDPEKKQGFLSFLPDTLSKISPDTALHTAIESVALANFYGRVKSTKLSAAHSGRAEYGRALLMLKDALENPAKSSDSETLFTVYLLGLYEIISFPKPNRGSWAVHTGGATALVRMQTRPNEPLSGLSARISRMITWTMVIQCVRSRIPPPATHIPWQDRFRSDLEGRLIDLMLQATGLSAELRMKRVLIRQTSQSKSNAEYEELVSERKRFYGEVDNFHDILMAHFPYTLETLPNEELCPDWLGEILTADGQPQVAHNHMTTLGAYLWNMFNVAQLRVEIDYQRAMVEAELENAASLARMSSLVESICASIYSAMTAPLIGKPDAQDARDVCGVRAYALLFPLSMAAHCLRGPLQTDPVIVSRASWVQLVLEHFQHTFSVSGAMHASSFNAF